MMEIGLWLAGAYLFVQLVVLVVGASRYLKMPLRAAVVAPVARAEIGEFSLVLDTVAADLTGHGFAYQFSLRASPDLAVDGMPDAFFDIWFHPGLAVTAQVGLSDLPTPARLCEMFLSTRLSDGSSLLTVNGYRHALPPQPASVTVADGDQPDFAGQLAHHRKMLAKLGKPAEVHAPTPEQQGEIAASLLGKLEAEGKVYRRGGTAAEPIYGIRLATALRMVWRMRRAARAMARSQKAAPVDFGAARPIAERAAFVRTLCALRGMSAPSWFRRASFVASAALFLGLGGWWWGLAGALSIAAVVLLHEAGHWAAMKLAGFRDVHVFFVPGMGGATSGEKHEAGPLTHLAVYLAGPVPGLVLALAGFACLLASPDAADGTWYPDLLKIILFSLAINAFNLLPVLPLDGGRIVELLVVVRLPWLRFVFSIASGVGFVAGGYATGDASLYAIGALMLFASQHHYHTARAAAAWLRQKGEAPAPDAPAAAGRLYDFLAQGTFAAWPFRTKLATSLTLLPRVHGRLPSWKESVGGLAVYVLCIVVPVGALWAMMLATPARFTQAMDETGLLASHTVAYSSRNEEETLFDDATIAAAKTDEERFDILYEAASYENMMGHFVKARAFAQRLYDETARIDPQGYQHGRAAFRLAETLSMREAEGRAASAADIARLVKEAETILSAQLGRTPAPKAALELARVWEWRARDASDAAILAMRERKVALLMAHLEPGDAWLADARRELAESLDRDKQFDASEALMQTMLADLERARMDTRRLAAYRLDAGWMYAAHGKFDEAARSVADDADAPSQYKDYSTTHDNDPRALMWMAQRGRGAPHQARVHALALSKAKEEEEEDGNALLRLLRPARKVLDDAATLMLIDAERALGSAAAADSLAARLRENYADRKTAEGTPLECRMRVHDTSWRRHYHQLLLDIEQRELHCEPPPPSLACGTGQADVEADEKKDDEETSDEETAGEEKAGSNDKR